MYEELFDESEKTVPSFHHKLHKAIPEMPDISLLQENFENLQKNLEEACEEKVIAQVQSIVPNFKKNLIAYTKNAV